MKNMTIKEIQSVGLRMMNDIHFFCVKNDIHYSLAYGTLLGAIRHNGFIPWDEDIDIWMPRKDYEKFIATFKCNDEFLFTSYKMKGNFLDIARLYEINETLVQGNLADNILQTGVWIDIFPIDFVADDEYIRKNEYNQLKKMWWHIRELRRLYNEKKSDIFYKRLKAQIYYYIEEKIHGSLFTLINKSNQLSSKHQKEKTSYCASLMCRDAFWKNKMEVFPKEWFNSFIIKDFQTSRFFVIEEYDKVLTSIYGKYMSLPPVEKQKPKLDHKFLWK